MMSLSRSWIPSPHRTLGAAPRRRSLFRNPCVSWIAAGSLTMATAAAAQTCTEEPALSYYTGGGQTVCPCFVAGEEAGAVFDVPAEHYPIEILRVGIGWASQFGGTGQTLEQSIHVYGAGLPDPGARLYSLDGPVLTDGAINLFDLEAQLGTVTVPSGPFTVTLEFASDNAGNLFAPSVVHDGNGCTPGGKNVIKAIPGGWIDICTQGLGGDWVFFVVYRHCEQTGVGEEETVVAATPAYLSAPSPNPLLATSEIAFFLAEPGRARLEVFDPRGIRVASLADREFPAGVNRLSWDGRDENGRRLGGGVYFVELTSGAYRAGRKIVLAR